MMDLNSALKTLRTPLHLQGTSDEALADAVEIEALRRGEPGGLGEVPILDSGFIHYPLQILHDLARATKPSYSQSVYDIHQFWGLLKYIGIFANDGFASYSLSSAGANVVHNQRRVLSEELGIGIALGVADSWLANGLRPGTTRVVDIDVALTRGELKVARLRRAVTQVGLHRPDYLIVCEDPRSPGLFEVVMLECKGTNSSAYSRQQLAHASSQLRGVTIGGSPARGLAVSSVVQNSVVRYQALRLDTDPATFHSRRQNASWRSGLRGGDKRATPELKSPKLDLPLPEEASLFLDDSDFDRQSDIEIEGGGDSVSAEKLVSSAVRASWSNLAEISGNPVAADFWATPQMREKKRDRVSEPTLTREINGLAVRGIVGESVLPGGRIRAILGVPLELYEALESGNARSVLDVQRRSSRERQPVQTPDDALLTHSGDGSIFALVAD